MTASLFTITAQTNLHAGSGDANYGIIDKLVQRDTLTSLPTIHASSLKGAILQHIDPQTGVTDNYISEVFGRQIDKRWKTPRVKNDPRDVSKSGDFIFMQANLLSIPVRSNARAFFRATGSRVLSELREHLLELGLLKDTDSLAVALATVAKESISKTITLDAKFVGSHHLEDLKHESFQITSVTGLGLDKLKELLGDAAVVLSNTKLRQLTDNHHLPVIARNHLESGQSTNLWYEQVVPRQTRFAFTLLRPDALTHANDFDTRLTQKGYVQIGANASVGYGYCNIENFKTA